MVLFFHKYISGYTDTHLLWQYLVVRDRSITVNSWPFCSANWVSGQSELNRPLCLCVSVHIHVHVCVRACVRDDKFVKQSACSGF